MKPRNLSYILASILGLFTASKWKGLAFWQKCLFVAVLYMALGVWAYGSQFWMIAWLLGIVLAIAGGVIFIVWDLFNLWKKE